MSDERPPFKKGDLLCLRGPAVASGRHVHVAGEPVNRSGWCNGWRPWGFAECATLGHATVEDIEHELRLEHEVLYRVVARIKQLREWKSRLAASPEGEA